MIQTVENLPPPPPPTPFIQAWVYLQFLQQPEGHDHMYYVPVRVHKNRLPSTFYNSVVSQAFKVKAAIRVVICYRGSRVTKSFSWILLNVRSCTLKFKKPQ